MKRINPLFLAAVLSVFAANSCSEDWTHHPMPDYEKPKPSPDPEPQVKKEKMLWFDAEANFRRFSTKEGIIAMLDKTVETGFNKIVVDVKPVEGDVLYESEFMTRATTIGSVTVADRDWDYLQFFLDEAHKRELKVTVSTTVFPMGMPFLRQGPAYRDNRWEGKTCLQYTPQGMVDIKDDPTKVAVFLNPVLPEVQEFALRFIREIVTKYDFDAFALDYCRYPDAQSDFSQASHEAFEKYIGSSVATWPDDIFTYDASGGMIAGKHYKMWWEFRAKVIHDFVARVRQEIKAIKPNVKLEYWAASWWGAIHVSGQNWASKSFRPLADPEAWAYRPWCSDTYHETGFADQLDTFLLGTYLPRVYGPEDGESIEYGINRAERMLLGACTYYATVECSQRNFDIEEACYYCLKRTEGLMVFDIVHVINNDMWSAIKRGIDRYEAEAATEK